MMEFEDIEYNASIRFPNYEAKWSMSSNQSNNPNSELVVRRRADLQVSSNAFVEDIDVLSSILCPLIGLLLRTVQELPISAESSTRARVL